MLLFALWVGATWEHNDASATADVPSWWFRERFVRTAHGSGLRDWNMVRAVIDGFVPNRFAKPRGETWVDEALDKAATWEDWRDGGEISSSLERLIDRPFEYQVH
jgi:hypothetical protein